MHDGGAYRVIIIGIDVVSEYNVPLLHLPGLILGEIEFEDKLPMKCNQFVRVKLLSTTDTLRSPPPF